MELISREICVLFPIGHGLLIQIYKLGKIVDLYFSLKFIPEEIP